MQNLFAIPERLDPKNKKINRAEKILHLSRYQYAAEIINKSNRHKKATILDAACGYGYGSYVLQTKTSARVVGVDLDPITVKYLTEKNKNKNIKFMKSNIISLPFPNSSFDIIVCFETIEHLTRIDGLKTLKEFKRVLKSKGLIIISSPNATLTKLIRGICSKYNNPFHLHEYAPGELEKIFQESNLEVVEKRGQYPFLPIIYLLSKYLFFLDFFFKPAPFFPLGISRYFILTAKKPR